MSVGEEIYEFVSQLRVERVRELQSLRLERVLVVRHERVRRGWVLFGQIEEFIGGLHRTLLKPIRCTSAFLHLARLGEQLRKIAFFLSNSNLLNVEVGIDSRRVYKVVCFLPVHLKPDALVVYVPLFSRSSSL